MKFTRLSMAFALVSALAGCATTTEPVGKIENVARSGITVQFSGKGQAHSAPSLKVCRLIVGQRLDGAILHSSIGRFGQRRLSQRQKLPRQPISRDSSKSPK